MIMKADGSRDGRSGAGKTRLAAELSAELGAAVVSLEDLYGGWDGLDRGIGVLVSEVLEPLAAGRTLRVYRSSDMIGVDGMTQAKTIGEQ